MRRHALLPIAAAAVLLLLLFFRWETAPVTPPDGPSATASAPPAPRRARSVFEWVAPATAPALEPAPEDEPSTASEPGGDTGSDTGLDALARVEVLLTDTDGRPVDGGFLYSPDCDIWLRVMDDGRTHFFIDTEGPCLFQGRRRDGLLWGRSEWLEVDLIAGEVASVTLEIPTERTGGLGVLIEPHDEGISVARVWPGTPAAEMGLQSGDIITAVDGLPAAVLTMEEFIEVMTGPVGTDVEFDLLYDADTGFTTEQLILTRAWLNN